MDEETLHNIDTRLALVEADLRSMAGTRKIILGMAAFLVMQAVAGVVAFTEMRTEFRNLNLGSYEDNVSTALVVLGDHGTELASVRAEQARLRGNIDALHMDHERMRLIIADKTRQRFYKSDGDKMEERILRLENLLFVSQNGGYE